MLLKEIASQVVDITTACLRKQWAMTLGETLLSVWKQVMEEGAEVVHLVHLEGKTYSVDRIRTKKLRTVRFAHEGYQLDGIEQNPQLQRLSMRLCVSGAIMEL